LYYFIIIILGMALGSFMNSWVWRTRENLDIGRSRSICPNCRVGIIWYDNIPVLSYFILWGKCRKCDAAISRQYPAVELLVGFVFFLIAFLHNAGQAYPTISIELARDLIIVVLLAFVFLYDLNYREILNSTTLLPGVILFPLSLFFGWNSWESMLLGIAFGAGFFILLYIISKGAWIGGGDIRLGFFMGVILGWPYILIAFFAAYMSGAIISVLLIALKKKTFKSETAFGTYLVFGAFVAMFWGSQILDWYLGLII